MAEIFDNSVTPYLTINGVAKAIEFYKTVFEAVVESNMMAEDGVRYMHATILINDSPIMMSDEFPEFGGFTAPKEDGQSSSAVALRYSTPDEVDRIYQLALDNGGKECHAPDNMFWGDRFAQVFDNVGHRWMLAAPLQ